MLLERTDQPDSEVALPERELGDLLAEELRRLDADQPYADALGVATGVAGLADAAGPSRGRTIWLDPMLQNGARPARRSRRCPSRRRRSAAAAAETEAEPGGRTEPAAPPTLRPLPSPTAGPGERRGVNSPEVVVHASADLLAKAAAARLVTRLVDAQAARGSASVVLTGGGVGTAVLRELRDNPARDAVDWPRVDVWWGDERWVPAADPERNDLQAREALLDSVAVDPAGGCTRSRRPTARSPGDPEAAAGAYAAELAAATRHEDHGPVPRFDVLMLGVGEEGHVASIFPESPAAYEERPVGAVRGCPKPPPVRLTMTFPTIHAATEVWLVAAGANKAAGGRAGARRRRAGPGARRRRPRPRPHPVAARPGRRLPPARLRASASPSAETRRRRPERSGHQPGQAWARGRGGSRRHRPVRAGRRRGAGRGGARPVRRRDTGAVPLGADDAALTAVLPLSDVLGTGHHACVSAGVAPGDTVAVVGDGAVGLCAVLAARRLGAERVIALSRNPARAALARRYGASEVVGERGPAAVERVRELTGGLGVDRALECVGTDLAWQTALGSVRDGGAVGTSASRAA